MAPSTAHAPLTSAFVGMTAIAGTWLLCSAVQRGKPSQPAAAARKETRGVDAAAEEPPAAQGSGQSCCGSGESCGSGGCGSTEPEAAPTPKPVTVTVLHASLTGTAAGFASDLVAAINTSAPDQYVASARDLGEYSDSAGADIEDRLKDEHIVIFIAATYAGGVAPGRSAGFCNWLTDFSLDFRVDRKMYGKVRFAVFGCGNSDYDQNFNLVAKSIENGMLLMGAQSLCPRGDGDDSLNMATEFNLWQKRVLGSLLSGDTTRAPVAVGKRAKHKVDGEVRLPLKEYRRRKRQAAARVAAELLAQDGAGSSSAEDTGGESDIDMEDLGSALQAQKTKSEKQVVKSNKIKPMVTPRHRAQLTKEGYKIIGSHSAVKLCRWTKAQLRGRGGCYKHTFYGITSYQCMEATPSLSCANKCVFCWRHHKNPVGREWRWEVDQPEMLVSAAIERHQQMIKELRGMPGVIAERMEEAMSVKHCALSLVGEPIMYPYISEFVTYLHERQISTFLVTNAQFPDAILNLPPVTQLYVSIDAGNREDLKAVDRPLFTDFWERYLACLDILRDKRQRTVYRVTLLKGHNMTCIEEYAQLIQRGQPTFVEIKGVTFCGDSKASDMTMANVPYHEEVRDFSILVCEACNRLAAKQQDSGGPKDGTHTFATYGCASEHAHSNCMLLGREDMKVRGTDTYCTWIDYDKFHKLIASGEPFGAVDYMDETPNWAHFTQEYGGKSAGFDPAETRFFRGGAGEENYRPSESGCG